MIDEGNRLKRRLYQKFLEPTYQPRFTTLMVETVIAMPPTRPPTKLSRIKNVDGGSEVSLKVVIRGTRECNTNR